MDEINVQMSLSSEDAYSRVAAKVRVAGYTPVRGVARMAYPYILVIRRLSDEAERTKLEALIRSTDPAAEQVTPRGSFVN